MKYTFLFIISILLVSSRCETARKEDDKEDHLSAIDTLINAMGVDLSRLKGEVEKLVVWRKFAFTP